MEDLSLILNPKDVKPSSINLPGSKSISNRVLLISALGNGDIEIENLLFSDDTKVMIECLQTLGIDMKVNQFLEKCNIKGLDASFPVKNAKLYVGNSGTTIRPLTAVLAFSGGEYIISGTKRMHERPIGDLVQSLNSIGAKISYESNINYPPLKILGSKIINNKIFVRGDISSQFLTSILIASPILAKNDNLEIEVIGELISKPYIDITLKLLKKFGLIVNNKIKNKFLIEAKQSYKNPSHIMIEGDASSATYFLAASAISGKKIKINGVGNKTIQGDIRFIEILKKMGVHVDIGDDWIEASVNSKLLSINEDLNHIPDAAMTLAVLALHAEGISVLRNIGSWRVKETDRLSAMTNELRKVGAIVKEGDDFIEIKPPLILKNAIIDTYDDHRMAMCFSLVSINGIFKKGSKITIKDPNCVNKTFPNYFNFLSNILD